jgi:hypothetical protein
MMQPQIAWTVLPESFLPPLVLLHKPHAKIAAQESTWQQQEMMPAQIV